MTTPGATTPPDQSSPDAPSHGAALGPSPTTAAEARAARRAAAARDLARRERRHRRRALTKGIATVATGAVLLALCLASYQQAFTDRTEVTVTADRAGLLLEPGADVTLRNVTVGKVLTIERRDPDRVAIRVGLNPNDALVIPADVTARIVSPSLLGPKYIDLLPAATAPAAPISGEPLTLIAEGDVVPTSRTQTEVNATFDDLMTLLKQIKPYELNQTLTALAGTLRGRGRDLGNYLVAANTYLAEVNPHLDALRADVRIGAEVASVYNAIAPQLLRLLDDLSTTGATLVDERAALDSLLSSLYATSAHTRAFLLNNRMPLRDALALLRTTTGTLARFAPMFPCLFRSINDFRQAAEPASGGRYPGLWTHLSLLPGATGYRAPDNLPRVVADRPDCSGGPIGTSGPTYQPRRYGDGSPDPNRPFGASAGQDLVTALFGNSSGRRR